MELNDQLIELVLGLMHPKEQGWKRLNNKVLDEVIIDAVFHRKGCPTRLVVLMEGSYFSKNDRALALHLQNMFLEQMNQRPVEVLLLYRALLFVPDQLPNGIRIAAYRSEPGQLEEDRLLEAIPLN